MKYKDYIKNCIKLETIAPNDPISIKYICAQYNTDKFDAYKECVATHSNDVQILDMEFSPHFDLAHKMKLNGISNTINKLKETNYYKMQKLYGKNYDAISRKAMTMAGIKHAIEFHHNIEHPIILVKPIVQNDYNFNRYEIWEGHHRIAMYLAMGFTYLNCTIAKAVRI